MSIHLLDLDTAIDYTEGIQGTFIGEPLGLIVLEDANNSNLYLGKAEITWSLYSTI